MRLWWKRFVLGWTVFFIILSGCRKRTDYDVLHSEILTLHEKMIAAHFDKNSDYLSQNLSDDYFEVREGEIHTPAPEEIRIRLKKYLSSTSFSEYRDIRPPLIGFSQDGSMAWSVVQVKVSGRRFMEDGTERPLDFICAWLTLYEKKDGTWFKRTEVSTFQ